MSTIEIRMSHSLPVAEAEERIKTRVLPEWRERFANRNIPVQERWDTKHHGEFRFTMGSKPIRAWIRVDEKTVRISIDLPPLMGLLASFFDEVIEQAMGVDLKKALKNEIKKNGNS